MSESFDVVVIGGGTAGLVTASGCARLGRRVALIEREALGGDCLWTGCVPTKALVASAKLAHQMRHATEWGLEPVAPKITPKSIMDSMRETQRVAGKHDDPETLRIGSHRHRDGRRDHPKRGSRRDRANPGDSARGRCRDSHRLEREVSAPRRRRQSRTYRKQKRREQGVAGGPGVCRLRTKRQHR